MQFASQIFVDGADPAEMREADRMLKKAGYPGVQGQTTNPSLIAKIFLAAKEKETGGKKTSGTETHRALNPGIVTVDTKQKISNPQPSNSEKAALAFWRRTVEEIATVTKGPISIQVVGDESLTVEQMLSQARDRITWIPNAVVKFPATTAGLAAAEIFCEEGPVNITLNFSQEQAAAVYVATKTHNYDVFVSPFVGRLDDRGENGMDVVANISEMYKKLGDNHVKVLTASLRNVKQILYALWLKSDAITIPFKVLKEWGDPSPGSGRQPFELPSADFIYDAPGLIEIPYRELSLDVDWRELDLNHDLTTSGLAKFWEDWKTAIT